MCGEQQVCLSAIRDMRWPQYAHHEGSKLLCSISLRPRPKLIMQCFKDKSKLDRVLADPRAYTGKLRLQTGLQLMAFTQASASACVCVCVCVCVCACVRWCEKW